MKVLGWVLVLGPVALVLSMVIPVMVRDVGWRATLAIWLGGLALGAAMTVGAFLIG